MKRIKRHKIKKEKSDCSSQAREQEEHDLAYFIHDRVELMHQVFSILKYKELKTMAPESVRNLAIGDLQELCTEELLGISSKRLLAILDGVEPPSDTESSSPSPPPDLETISLDSISSDEELLASSGSKKKKHKHRHRNIKSKSKKKEKSKEPEPQTDENTELSRASRAGLTVLELLELQARARAIRAQLQQEQANIENRVFARAYVCHLNHERDALSAVLVTTARNTLMISGIVDAPVDAKKDGSNYVLIILGKHCICSRKQSICESICVSFKSRERCAFCSASHNSKEYADDLRNCRCSCRCQKERPSETTAIESNHHSSDNDEVEIKEEPPDVVEISSEDEKPDVNQLQKSIVEKAPSPRASEPGTVKDVETDINSKLVTKRINDLIITVPQAKTSRKIKLNRNKVTLPVANESSSLSTDIQSLTSVPNTMDKSSVDNSKNKQDKASENKARKKKKDKKKKSLEKDGSDHDEITLQLSDSEKMDLFEDLDESRKNYDRVSSSSEDTESSSSDSEDINCSKDISPKLAHSVAQVESQPTKSAEENNDSVIVTSEVEKVNNPNEFKGCDTVKVQNIGDPCNEHDLIVNKNEEHDSGVGIIDQPYDSKNGNLTKNNEGIVEIKTTDLPTMQNTDGNKNELIITNVSDNGTVTILEKSVDKEINILDKHDSPFTINEDKEIEIASIEDIPVLNDLQNRNDGEESQAITDNYQEFTKNSPQKELELAESSENYELNKETRSNLSDGELSDRQSSEVEAIDVQPVVVCISDEEGTKHKHDKKKKKKDRKSKKEKKCKKPKSDFHDGADQNFYTDVSEIRHKENDTISLNNISVTNDKPLELDSDDVYEILELSDDSSCYEVEGTILSKEPTAEEIEALSAKIDEIEREEVVTEQQIREHEQLMTEKEIDEQSDGSIDKISWKDRYLVSYKVKKVLTTANILNALRKKNKELKKKIEYSKKKEDTDNPNEKDSKGIHIHLEEGSMQQYKALQGSTKYVDPIYEDNIEASNDNDNCKKNNSGGEVAEKITSEMKKDAKQLLKMYKRLLKYNDANKQKDPNKKKKKKNKKRDKQDSVNKKGEASDKI